MIEEHIGIMAESDTPQPKQPRPTKQVNSSTSLRKPLQVMHISRKREEELAKKNQSTENPENNSEVNQNNIQNKNEGLKSPLKPSSPESLDSVNKQGSAIEEGLTMDDLLEQERRPLTAISSHHDTINPSPKEFGFAKHVLDDFDFDEDEFLAALDENEPIGITGEVAKGKVIGIESDGVYVDIGGKAPGFMPKKECGLGVITNIKERFPKGLEVEVLVTRDQNADGMVTISCRALALRKSWDKVKQMEKEGKIVPVKINGFNRGGVTCDLEGLRGFIPRSQLEHGEEHQSLVGKTLGTAFLEVNPDTRKLVLSEKKAATLKIFNGLEIGQLVEGTVISIKPYGFFVELGGVSGLLHQSVITNGSIRSLREVFKQGEKIKAVITDLDPKRGRIGLNTALLEGPPGEILIEKEKIMIEAEERAVKAKKVMTEANDKTLKVENSNQETKVKPNAE
tara:strand:+ start:96 stop:1454 length:1359 start_codon:yes stop_codon:yes gene_type:complete